MYNDRDEMLEEKDYEEDVQLRKALLEEVKQIDPELSWNEVFREITDLQKRWRRISYWESAFEDELTEEFETYVDAFYAKRKAGYENNQTLKKELIARAKALLASKKWNEATTEMNALMEQWKAIGSAGKDTDDALWEEFRNVRQTFFDNKKNYWAEMRGKFASAKETKENLIEQAEALKESEEWKKTGDAYHKLLEEWKAAGNAGREFEDDLWQKFNEARQYFFERRNAYYDTLRAQFEEKYQAKKALVEKAKGIVDEASYSKEHTAVMKNLNKEWKTIGSCGKEREDEIWNEFRSTVDAYFDGLTKWNEQRHQQWLQRMNEIRSRKAEFINDQKRLVKRMQDEIVGLIGEKQIQEMEDRIEDKKAFILEQEAELAELDKKIEQR